MESSPSLGREKQLLASRWGEVDALFASAFLDCSVENYGK